MRAYIAAYGAWKAARDIVKDLRGWDGNPYMTLVQTNLYERRQQALRAAAEDRD